MTDPSLKQTKLDPFETLGLPSNADEQQIRARYLELVKQFPPEREPEKFRQIQAAFAAARDPLTLADSLLEIPDNEDPPSWQDALDAQARKAPPIPVDFLLSLGNLTKSPSAQTSVDDGELAQQAHAENTPDSIVEHETGGVDE